MHKFFLFLLVISNTAIADTVLDRVAKDELLYMADDNPVMRKAFKVARESLDEFLKLSTEKSALRANHALKVAITEGLKTEYFWVDGFETKGGDKFIGRINNDPNLVKNVEYGQRYEFSRSQIVDWVYLDRMRGKMVGNFTFCALLTQESKEQAAAAKEQFNLDCSKIE